MSLIESIKKLFRKSPEQMSDEELKKTYVEAGSRFGGAVSYIYMGECVGFEDMLAAWEALEVEWSKRGFHTHSLDEFMAFGGYGTPMNRVGIKRDADEEIVLHAKIYRDVWLGKVKPSVTVAQMLEGPTVGTCVIPSTEKISVKNGPYRK